MDGSVFSGAAIENETAEQCIIREFREESGLTVSAERLRKCHTIRVSGFTIYLLIVTEADFLAMTTPAASIIPSPAPATDAPTATVPVLSSGPTKA